MDKLNASDEELMSLYQKGDYAAFELLFSRHSGRLLGYFQKRVGPETAEDLLQDFFQKLHRSRNLYQASYPVMPWFFLLARQMIVNHFRKNGKYKYVEMSDEYLASDSNESSRANDLNDVLYLLDQNQRKVLIDRYQKDWTFEQMAQSLNTSESNARKLVSRAIQKLRLLLINQGG